LDVEGARPYSVVQDVALENTLGSVWTIADKLWALGAGCSGRLLPVSAA
jgi:hypothetical protein